MDTPRCLRRKSTHTSQKQHSSMYTQICPRSFHKQSLPHRFSFKKHVTTHSIFLCACPDPPAGVCAGSGCKYIVRRTHYCFVHNLSLYVMLSLHCLYREHRNEMMICVGGTFVSITAECVRNSLPSKSERIPPRIAYTHAPSCPNSSTAFKAATIQRNPLAGTTRPVLFPGER